MLQKHLKMAQAIAEGASKNGTADGTLRDTLAQESPDQWRASKLAGVAVYGPEEKDVGKITDVLLSKDGKAQFVIIGVGGFLGNGEKDVAVPYDQVKFTDQPRAHAIIPTTRWEVRGSLAARPRQWVRPLQMARLKASRLPTPLRLRR